MAELLPGETGVRHYEYRKTNEYDRFAPSRLITSIDSMEPLLHLKMREMMTARSTGQKHSFRCRSTGGGSRLIR
ncbi:hypothetical protein ACFPFV_00215 [Salinicoccus siamensis]|uniref:hypothetical protein n=1 Tax=Salinicoccus siamensis TaxID=381830 RepID=UPI00360DC1E4